MLILFALFNTKVQTTTNHTLFTCKWLCSYANLISFRPFL